MQPSYSLLAFLVSLLLAPVFPFAAAADISDSNTTVFSILPRYGLPEGLLPDAVASYSLEEDGRFVVELGRPSCYVQFGSYLVYYERRITGTLKIGSIRDLEGIQVQRFFLWLGVDEIKVDLPPTDYIYFRVGWITKRLPVEDFRQIHACQDRSSYQGYARELLPEPFYEMEVLTGGNKPAAPQKQVVLTKPSS